MRLFVLAILISFGLSGSAGAAAPSYSVIKEKSFIKFFAIQNNAPIEGKFKEFSADITFDADHLDQSIVTVEVKTGSVEASYDEVAKNIKTPDWLSTDQFPTAIFKTKNINRMPMSDNYYAEGELTLRGKTSPVTLNFQLEQPSATTAIAKGYVTLHRNDFGVGQGEWSGSDTIKNEVRVEFRITAQKQ